MDKEQQMRQIAKLGTIFSPGAPVDKYALFAGRTAQVRDVLNAVTQRGQHIILFGERGVGKTSLANVLSEVVQAAGFLSLNSGTVNCDANDDFASLWRKVLRELSIDIDGPPPLGFERKREPEQLSLEGYLGDQPSPEDVRFALSQLGRTIIIIDELDRLNNRSATNLLADTIKTLSDHSVDTTLILVGVADSVDQLIIEHRSIERSLVQVRMPRMYEAELHEITDKGLSAAGMKCEPEVRREVARLSQGLPHYTHLLSLHAAQEALLNDRETVRVADLEISIQTAVEKAQQSIVSAHHKATRAC